MPAQTRRVPKPCVKRICASRIGSAVRRVAGAAAAWSSVASGQAQVARRGQRRLGQAGGGAHRVEHRARRHLGGQRAQHASSRRAGRCRRWPARTACRRRSSCAPGLMLRARPSCAIVRQLVGLRLGQHARRWRRRRWWWPCRPAARAGSSPRSSAATLSQRRAAVGAARAGEHAAGGRVDDVADGVDRHQRAHRDGADLQRRGADAALHRALDAEQLAHRGAGAGADAALRRRLARCAASQAA